MTEENSDYTGAWNSWTDDGYHQHLRQHDHYHGILVHPIDSGHHHHQQQEPPQEPQQQQQPIHQDHYLNTIEDAFSGHVDLQNMPNMHHIHMNHEHKKPRRDFEYRFREVYDFKLKYGHLNIPHKFDENPSLGHWVDTMRRRYRKLLKSRKESTQHNKTVGTKSQLEYQVDKLNSIGFEFEPRSGRVDTWDHRISQLQKFKEENGHCNVREDDVTYNGLGKWVSYIRRVYRLAKTGRRPLGKRLTEEKIDILKDLGFVFELREEQMIKRFKDGLATLKEYYLEHGDCRVPSFYAPNPTFGLCVEDMRKEYRDVCNQISLGKEAISACIDTDMVHELAAMDFLVEEGYAPFSPHSTEEDSGKIPSLPVETLDAIIDEHTSRHVV
jgi:hypothetical protein